MSSRSALKLGALPDLGEARGLPAHAQSDPHAILRVWVRRARMQPTSPRPTLRHMQFWERDGAGTSWWGAEDGTSITGRHTADVAPGHAG